MNPNKPQYLTKEQERLALYLWSDEVGHGPGTIARMFGVNESKIKSLLRKHGLHRTSAEAIAIRKKNGLLGKYYQSLYKCIDTPAGESVKPSDVEYAYVNGNAKVKR